MRPIVTLLVAVLLSNYAWSQEEILEPTPVYPDDLSAADAVIFSQNVFSRNFQSYGGGAIVPLLSDDRNLIHVEANFAWTDPLEEQINVGLVHRWQFPGKDWVVGENVFFDWANGPSGNGYAGVGAGAEILSPDFEVRFNYYWPDSRKSHLGTTTSQETTTGVTPDGDPYLTTNDNEQFFLNQDFIRKTTTTTEQCDFFEVPMEGFDVEAGIPLRIKKQEVVSVPVGGKNPVFVESLEESQWPANLNLWAFVGYQDHQNPHGPDQAGFKGRLEWRVNPHLLIEGTYYENPWPGIGGNWYTGFRVNCPLDDPNDNRNLVSKLLTPEAPTWEKDRWLQRVVRERRFGFAQIKKAAQDMRMVTERFTQTTPVIPN